MHYSIIVIMQICFVFLLQNRAFGQENVNTKKLQSINIPTTIVTKIPFNGVNYYIQISPIDVQDPMPVYNPHPENEIVWNDSLQHLFPDSILKQLPEQKNNPHRDFNLKQLPEQKKQPKKNSK